MKNLGELKVSDYMARQAICIKAADRLTEAIQIMDDEGLTVLPVLDKQGRLVGILSSSDLIEITHELQSDIESMTHMRETTRRFLVKLLIEQGDKTLVGDVMTSPVETISPQTNLVVAARKIVDRPYHHLPVVDDTGAPIGMLSTKDFVRAVADHGALMAG